MEEKFTGHFPVNTGSYRVGKVGYIGGKDSFGYGRCGITAGDISMGSKKPVVGAVAISNIVDKWLGLECVSCATT